MFLSAPDDVVVDANLDNFNLFSAYAWSIYSKTTSPSSVIFFTSNVSALAFTPYPIGADVSVKYMILPTFTDNPVNSIEELSSPLSTVTCFLSTVASGFTTLISYSAPTKGVALLSCFFKSNAKFPTSS